MGRKKKRKPTRADERWKIFDAAEELDGKIEENTLEYSDLKTFIERLWRYFMRSDQNEEAMSRADASLLWAIRPLYEKVLAIEPRSLDDADGRDSCGLYEWEVYALERAFSALFDAVFSPVYYSAVLWEGEIRYVDHYTYLEFRIDRFEEDLLRAQAQYYRDLRRDQLPDRYWDLIDGSLGDIPGELREIERAYRAFYPDWNAPPPPAPKGSNPILLLSPETLARLAAKANQTLSEYAESHGTDLATLFSWVRPQKFEAYAEKEGMSAEDLLCRTFGLTEEEIAAFHAVSRRKKPVVPADPGSRRGMPAYCRYDFTIR